MNTPEPLDTLLRSTWRGSSAYLTAWLEQAGRAQPDELERVRALVEAGVGRLALTFMPPTDTLPALARVELRDAEHAVLIDVLAQLEVVRPTMN